MYRYAYHCHDVLKFLSFSFELCGVKYGLPAADRNRIYNNIISVFQVRRVFTRFSTIFCPSVLNFGCDAKKGGGLYLKHIKFSARFRVFRVSFLFLSSGP
jgi:hypothetical protein